MCVLSQTHNSPQILCSSERNIRGGIRAPPVASSKMSRIREFRNRSVPASGGIAVFPPRLVRIYEDTKIRIYEYVRPYPNVAIRIVSTRSGWNLFLLLSSRIFESCHRRRGSVRRPRGHAPGPTSQPTAQLTAQLTAQPTGTLGGNRGRPVGRVLPRRPRRSSRTSGCSAPVRLMETFARRRRPSSGRTWSQGGRTSLGAVPRLRM